MKRSLLLVVLVIIATFGGMLYLYPNKKETSVTPSPVTQPSSKPRLPDFKASFAIFTNGTFRIFSDTKYHNLSSNVYIESGNPNVIHVKKEGITWNDFFKTLPMTLNKECIITGTGQKFCTDAMRQLKFYINGQMDNDGLDREINDGDKLLVSFGAEKEAEIKIQLQQIP